jgi:DNA-directed RNA polymerase specialized sigma24 family protein
MENKNPKILNKQMMRYEGMTSAQLLSAILLCNKESATVLWYLLSERLLEKLQLCYNQCGTESEVGDFKTFDDYLSDFYIYLYEGHPDYVTHPTQFHYLQTISDNMKFDAWIQRSFKQFLSNERRALTKLTEALPVYLQELKADQLKDPAIELTRIAFSLAWYNQFESVEDRYIFFRSMKKKVVKSFNRSEELNDEETAQALGKKYNSYRSQVSRCCKEVQRLMTEMTHEDIAKLDANSLLLVDRISNIDEDSLDEIIDGLVVSAERQLPQYDDILEARIRKSEERSCRLEESMPSFKEFSPAEISFERIELDSQDLADYIPESISFRKKKSPVKEAMRHVEELRKVRKRSFIEGFVSSFKSFIKL